MKEVLPRFLNPHHWGALLKFHLNDSDRGVVVDSPLEMVWNCSGRLIERVSHEQIAEFADGSLSAIWLEDLTHCLEGQLLEWWEKLAPGGYIGGPSWGCGPMPAGRFAVDTRSMVEKAFQSLGDASERFTGNEGHPCWFAYKHGSQEEKVLIISGSDIGQLNEFGSISRKNHAYYAQKHGYDYRWLTWDLEEWDRSRVLSWAKIRAVVEALEEGTWDQVWWMDADTIFLNPAKKMHRYLHPKWTGVFPEFVRDDRVMLSTGVFGCRSSAKPLLEYVWKMGDEKECQSLCEEVTLGKAVYRDPAYWTNIQLVEHSLFNGFFGWNVHLSDPERNFICHMVGRSNGERREVFSEVNQFLRISDH